MVVQLRNPEFTSIFLNNITNALSFNSNLCNGKPSTFIKFKNSVGYKLLSQRHSLLYRHYIDALLLFLLKTILPQSQFLGVRIAESFSLVPENIFGKIAFTRVYV